MPAGLHHPFTNALYERHDDGEIKVTQADSGKSGVFTDKGKWVSGELRECDPQLCGWVAGPQFANHRMSDSTEH